ncbi:hypothetical protein CRG98_037507 [Punica granatum]|uniref:Uncharacterized protein n=1 Tax=Punica granatum TaxID=22663 RepID=A0A2I0IDI0_PUNGR|nr:hypothetical protein CRG98_037507 [Punica granatum]
MATLKKRSYHAQSVSPSLLHGVGLLSEREPQLVQGDCDRRKHAARQPLVRHCMVVQAPVDPVEPRWDRAMAVVDLEEPTVLDCWMQPAVEGGANVMISIFGH